MATSIPVTEVDGETIDIETDLRKRSPNYGWLEPGQVADPALQITLPDGRNTQKFREICIAKVTRPDKRRTVGEATEEKRKGMQPFQD